MPPKGLSELHIFGAIRSPGTKSNENEDDDYHDSDEAEAVFALVGIGVVHLTSLFVDNLGYLGLFSIVGPRMISIIMVNGTSSPPRFGVLVQVVVVDRFYGQHTGPAA